MARVPRIRGTYHDARRFGATPRRRFTGRRLSLEALEARRLLTATVEDAYATASETVQAAINDGALLVDPTNLSIASVAGIDPTAVNVDQAGEIESYVQVNSLDDTTLLAIVAAGGRVTSTDPYSMVANAWIKPADVNAIRAVPGVTTIYLPTLCWTDDPTWLATAGNQPPTLATPPTITTGTTFPSGSSTEINGLAAVLAMPGVPDDAPFDDSWLLSGAECSIRVSLRAVDMKGNPISQVQVGQQFQIEEFVTDTTPNPEGVFSFLNNLNFNAALASSSGPITFPPGFPCTFPGDSSPGVLNAGAVLSLASTDGSDWKLFTATLTAKAAGQLTVSTSDDGLPGHDLLVFESLDLVAIDNIDFGSLNLTIVDAPADSSSSPPSNADVPAVPSSAAPLPANSNQPEATAAPTISDANAGSAPIVQTQIPNVPQSAPPVPLSSPVVAPVASSTPLLPTSSNATAAPVTLPASSDANAAVEPAAPPQTSPDSSRTADCASAASTTSSVVAGLSPAAAAIALPTPEISNSSAATAAPVHSRIDPAPAADSFNAIVSARLSSGVLSEPPGIASTSPNLAASPIVSLVDAIAVAEQRKSDNQPAVTMLQLRPGSGL